MREATVWQAQQIAVMWIKMMVELGTPKEDIDGEYFLVRLIAQINSPEHCVLVALDDGIPIGMITGYVDRGDCLRHIVGTCFSLYVEKKYRGNGLLDKLVNGMHEFFESVGARDEEFFTEYNSGLIKTWERKGYKPYKVLFRKEV